MLRHTIFKESGNAVSEEPVYILTFGAMDGNAGSSKGWHAFFSFSLKRPGDKKVEVVTTWGFYGLPPVSKDPALNPKNISLRLGELCSHPTQFLEKLKISVTHKIKARLKLDLDFSNNHGMLRHEEMRYLHLDGLHGKNFILSKEKFDELQNKCLAMVDRQSQAIDEWAKELNLTPKKKFRIYAYEDYSKIIFELEKMKHAIEVKESELERVKASQEKKDDIAIQEKELERMKKALEEKKQAVREKNQITDEKKPVIEEKKQVAKEEKQEKQLSEMKGIQKEKIIPRLQPFELSLRKSAHSCKVQALELFEGILPEEEIEGLRGWHFAISRLSGPMLPILWHSVGPVCTYPKSSGRVGHSRNAEDKNVKLYWTIPPQEVATKSNKVDKLFHVHKDYNDIKQIACQLQQLEWLFRDATLTEHASYRLNMIKRIRKHYEVFATIESPLSFPPQMDKVKLAGNLAKAKDLINTIYNSAIDNWKLEDEGGEALAAYLSPKDKKKLCAILGRSYVEYEPVSFGRR